MTQKIMINYLFFFLFFSRSIQPDPHHAESNPGPSNLPAPQQILISEEEEKIIHLWNPEKTSRNQSEIKQKK